MSESDGWLDRYESSHSKLSNPVVYWAAVPMVVVGTVGLLWYLPIPAEFAQISPLLNWGSAFLMATTIYYFIISLSLAIGMLPFILGLASKKGNCCSRFLHRNPRVGFMDRNWRGRGTQAQGSRRSPWWA